MTETNVLQNIDKNNFFSFFLFQALKCAPFGPVSLGIARPLNSGKEAEVRKKFVDRNNDRREENGGGREKSSNLKSPNGKENNSGNSTAPSDSQAASDMNENLRNL